MEPMEYYDPETGGFHSIEVKEFKVQEVIDAVATDGFDHLRKEWFQTSYEGKLIGGCVLGQGAANLGAYPTDDGLDLGFPQPAYWTYYPLNSDVAARPTLVHQLDRFDVTYASKWYVGSKAGGTIIHWNDHTSSVMKTVSCAEYQKIEGYCYEHVDTEGEQTEGTHEIDTGQEFYTLETYAEVAQMVKDILEPYRDETIYLAVFDYSGFTAPEGVMQNA